MKKIGFILFGCVWAIVAQAQGIAGYEYWFDDDYVHRTSEESTSEVVTLTLDVSTLANGIHSFNFRAKGNNDKWSSPISQYFHRASTSHTGNTPTHYEYWIDEDYANRKNGDMDASGLLQIELDAAALPVGIHHLSFRVQDSFDTWSSPVTYYFYRSGISHTGNTLKEYEYWIDNNYEARQTGQPDADGLVQLTDLNVSALPVGIHNLSFRMKDSFGTWSSPVTYYFYRTGMAHTGNTLTDYEYWIDGDYEKRQTVSPDANETGADGLLQLPDLDLSALPVGIHHLSFRAKDSFGVWSSPVTYYFYRTGASHAGNVLTEYEYWIDSNYQARQKGETDKDGQLPLSELDVASLPMGVHYLNVRAKDSFGAWSSPVTYYFYRTGISHAGNTLTKYEYWIDDNYNTRQNGELSADGTLVLNDLSLPDLAEGVHYFNFRVQDAFGAWSSTVSYCFYRLAHHRPVKNLITHYRYVFNNDPTTAKTVTLDPPVNPLEWEGQLFDIPEFSLTQLPDSFGLELGNTPGKATLSIPAEADFMIQFKDSASQWSRPVVSQFNHKIRRNTTLSTAELNKAFTVQKPAAGEALTYRVDIIKEDSIFWKADQPCEANLYASDGTWYGKIPAMKLLEGSNVKTPVKGTYYAVFHSAVKDAMYNQPNMTLICIGRNASDTIHVDIAGTLPQLVADPKNLINLTLTGYLNGTDIKFIRSLSRLQKLDIGGAHIVEGGEAYYKTYRTADEVTGQSMFTGLSQLTRLILSETTTALGASALQGCSGLSELTLPTTVTKVGTDAFSGCKNLLIVNWNSQVSIPASAFDTPSAMGNCLIYAPSGTACTYEGNVIIGGTAEKISLTHAKAFRCPESFKAKDITYTRNFSMTSGKGIAAGWETVVLPFDVQTFGHAEKGELAPFNSGKDNVKPFWLRRLTSDGFKDVTTLEANTPYIISMPNSDAYEEEFNIRGNVTFHAADADGVEVKATDAASLIRLEGPEFTMAASYEKTLKHDTVYAINLSVYNNIAVGGAFVKNQRDVSPFEAYALSKQNAMHAPKYYSIDGGDATGLDKMLMKKDASFKAYTKGNVLYIETDKSQSLSIYATDGHTVRIIEVHKGMNIINGLDAGIYFLEKIKIVIGH